MERFLNPNLDLPIVNLTKDEYDFAKIDYANHKDNIFDKSHYSNTNIVEISVQVSPIGVLEIAKEDRFNYVISSVKRLTIWICYDSVNNKIFGLAMNVSKKSEIMDTTSFVKSQNAPENLVSPINFESTYFKTLKDNNNFNRIKNEINPSIKFDASELVKLVAAPKAGHQLPTGKTISLDFIFLIDGITGLQYLTLAAPTLASDAFIAGVPCPPVCYYS